MRLTQISSILLLAGPCFASTFQVSVNAGSLPHGTTGFIDFAFNGGYPATAVISNFSNAGGSLNSGTIFTQGTVTGALPGSVTMGDDNTDYDEGITYGSPIGFLLTLSGTPSGSTGDVFTLSLFDSAFDGLLTANVNDGWILQFQMDTLGNTTPLAYANPSGGPSFVTVSAVPEPATWFFTGASLAVILFVRHGKNKSALRENPTAYPNG
jgi:hypothetical protein